MHRLLVAVDNSDNAARALDYAVRLAKESGQVELHIVYAHAPPVVYGEIAIYMPEERVRELQERHSKDILEPAIAKATAAGVPFRSSILVGDVSHVLVKCAEDNDCDGIVMGTRGMGAIGNLLMGSVATKVVHLSKLPVTLVK